LLEIGRKSKKTDRPKQKRERGLIGLIQQGKRCWRNKRSRERKFPLVVRYVETSSTNFGSAKKRRGGIKES
jgi:hypothetical protein